MGKGLGNLPSQERGGETQLMMDVHLIFLG